MAMNISNPKKDGIFKRLGGIIGVRILTILAIASVVAGVMDTNSDLKIPIGANKYNVLGWMSGSLFIWFICLVASTRHTVRYFNTEGLDERELALRNRIFAHAFGLVIFSSLLIPTVMSISEVPRNIGDTLFYSQDYVGNLAGVFLWTAVLMPFVAMSTGGGYLELRKSRAKK